MAPSPDPTADALGRGLALYRDGCYFEAHEVWEDRWRLARADERRLLHGLIQLAAAHVQLDRGKAAGAARLLHKAGLRLAPLGARCSGVDLERLRAEAERRLVTSRPS